MDREDEWEEEERSEQTKKHVVFSPVMPSSLNFSADSFHARENQPSLSGATPKQRKQEMDLPSLRNIVSHW